MAIRSSMNTLVDRVRLLIADTGGTGQVFSDQEIQDALDVHGSSIRYMALTEMPTIAAGGAVSYLDFYADYGNWEENAVLVDSAYNVLTPATSETHTGHWTTSTQPTLPVMISGAVYDVYAAAADLLEAWAGKVKLDFDFSTQGQAFTRSQKIKALLDMAQVYRAKQQPITVNMTRD